MKPSKREPWSRRKVTPSAPAGLAACLALVLASQTWAQSGVEVTLELGGNNHAESWKSWDRSGPWPHDRINEILFTPGSPANDQTFILGDLLTWDVRLKASGTQVNRLGAGQPILGVASFSFNLELHQATANGPLATAAVFMSTINDGQNRDPLAAAAFPLVYDVDGLGPGRLVDPYDGAYPRGGPHCGGVDAHRLNKLTSALYPFAAPSTGKLIGMGAGYLQWTGSAGAGRTTPGVGMTVLPTGAGLGEMPVCEGQIEIIGLTPGPYVLVLVPGTRMNVLRGDVDLTRPVAAFATALDQPAQNAAIRFVVSDLPGRPRNPQPASASAYLDPSVTLSWTAVNATSYDVCLGTSNPPPLMASDLPGPAGSCTPPALAFDTQYFWQVITKRGTQSTPGAIWSFSTRPPFAAIAWRSVQTHGSNTYDIPFYPTPPGQTRCEPRIGGVRQIAIDFNNVIEMIDPPLIKGTDGSHPEISSMQVSQGGASLYLDLAAGALKSGVCYTVDISNSAVAFEDGQPLEAGKVCSFTVLAGDTTENGVVNLGDALHIRSKIGQAVTASTAAFDINLDGVIDAADIVAAKAAIGGSVPGCPAN